MFMIMGTLLLLDRTSKKGADKVQAFFNPALNWVQRWLPLFYVPTLVVLPQAVEGIAGAPSPLRCQCESSERSIITLLPTSAGEVRSKDKLCVW